MAGLSPALFHLRISPRSLMRNSARRAVRRNRPLYTVSVPDCSNRAASIRSCEIIERACRLRIAFGSPGSAGVPPAHHVECAKYGYARETRALPGRSIRCQRELIFSHLLSERTVQPNYQSAVRLLTRAALNRAAIDTWDWACWGRDARAPGRASLMRFQLRDFGSVLGRTLKPAARASFLWTRSKVANSRQVSSTAAAT